MASIMKEAPNGYESAIELINSLKHEDLTELGSEVLQFLQYKIGAVNTEKWRKKLEESAEGNDLQKTQSIINALIYTFRSAARYRVTVEELTAELDSSMVFSDKTCTILCNLWSTQGKQLMSCSLGDHVLGVGQLIDVQWKVGMAMSSDTCRQLNSPFVTLTLTVADAGGNLKTHPLELTMDQFRVS
ncbi:COMM domain-containing protein 6-like isoform X3 [Ruditapes philippinarum]|uniref:COMM domain-containing protein 6-like isoform X3 n=1 Tax=Ruditapes philippinarum TaxID=129788 RepID=UPI00295AE66B|nr:COMM domain-containing protein 6-like isoform X3 [Ruditapes philippinarum]